MWYADGMKMKRSLSNPCEGGCLLSWHSGPLYPSGHRQMWASAWLLKHVPPLAQNTPEQAWSLHSPRTGVTKDSDFMHAGLKNTHGTPVAKLSRAGKVSYWWSIWLLQLKPVCVCMCVCKCVMCSCRHVYLVYICAHVCVCGSYVFIHANMLVFTISVLSVLLKKWACGRGWVTDYMGS